MPSRHGDKLFLRAQLAPHSSEAAVLVAARDMTDSDRVSEFFRQCERVIKNGNRSIVLDLHEVECADTKLVACIVAVYQIARGASARLELCLSDAVRELTRVCRLEWLTNELGVNVS